MATRTDDSAAADWLESYRFGLRVLHGWGMTETTPVGTVNYIKREIQTAGEEESYALRSTQGIPLPFVEVRAMTVQGPAPWDGQTMGELQVRGPWVAASYHDSDEGTGKWTEDGWFCTGDVVTIDARGYVKITDRIKDLIRSGGEWISSVDLEIALVGHPTVSEAAVIAVPHPKWGERPLAVVVLRDGQSATADELREYIAPRFASYWLPDDVVFVAEMPRTSTGKMMKAELRERYKDFKLRDQ